MKHHTLNAFLTWAEENNIHWDKDAIEIREGKHGLGIYAKKNLDAGYEGTSSFLLLLCSMYHSSICCCS